MTIGRRLSSSVLEFPVANPDSLSHRQDGQLCHLSVEDALVVFFGDGHGDPRSSAWEHQMMRGAGGRFTVWPHFGELDWSWLFNPAHLGLCEFESMMVVRQKGGAATANPDNILLQCNLMHPRCKDASNTPSLVSLKLCVDHLII